MSRQNWLRRPVNIGLLEDRNVVYVTDPAKCGGCGAVYPGIRRLKPGPSYCGHECAVLGQPDKVFKGAGKGTPV